MNTYCPNAQELKKAEYIRRQYISRNENTMEQLQKLDNKVKAPGKIVSCLFGIIGALVMGAGMSMITVWSNMLLGLALSIPGLIVALLAYPVYSLITNKRKKKYASEIMRLSDEIVNE